MLTLPPLLSRIASLAENIRDHLKTDPNKDRIHVNILKLRAMRWLALVVFLYFVCVQLTGVVLMAIYLAANARAKQFMIDNGVTSITWFSIFHVVSAFNNMGLGLFPGNFVPYADDFFILFIMGGLTLGYPGTVTAFSAQLRPLSKVIMIIILLMGRHRGLPTELDAAYTMHIRLAERPDFDDDKVNRNSAMLEAEAPDEYQVRHTDAEGQIRTYVVRRRSSNTFWRTSHRRFSK